MCVRVHVRARACNHVIAHARACVNVNVTSRVSRTYNPDPRPAAESGVTAYAAGARLDAVSRLCRTSGPCGAVGLLLPLVPWLTVSTPPSETSELGGQPNPEISLRRVGTGNSFLFSLGEGSTDSLQEPKAL